MSLANLKPGDAVCVEIFGYRYGERPKVESWVVQRIGRKFIYAIADGKWSREQGFDRETGIGKDFRARAHANHDELMQERELVAIRKRTRVVMRNCALSWVAKLSKEQCEAILSILEPTP